MNKSPCSVGLLGRGRFGSMVVEHLSRDFPLVWRDEATPGGATLEQVAASDIVILCVPIRRLRQACREIGPLLRPGQLILDTCSVKVRPLAWMAEILPEFVDIIGTHPLFGPDSGRNGIQGLKIALCPVRGERLELVRGYLESLGLRVLVDTPDQHDREMAETQAVFHLIARGIQDAGLTPRRISTPGPDQFFDLMRSLQNDSRELFFDLESQNPYAAEVRRKLIQALIDLDAGIAQLESRLKSGTPD